jgi:ABC-type branched-subunit amino acid transport system ATPase component
MHVWESLLAGAYLHGGRAETKADMEKVFHLLPMLAKRLK